MIDLIPLPMTTLGGLLVMGISTMFLARRWERTRFETYTSAWERYPPGFRIRVCLGYLLSAMFFASGIWLSIQ